MSLSLSLSLSHSHNTKVCEGKPELTPVAIQAVRVSERSEGQRVQGFGV